MAYRNTTTSYGSISKGFHWLLFVLITGMLIYGFLLDSMPKDYKAFAYNTHKLIGLTILALTLIRLLWAMINLKPALPAGTRWYEYALERLVHWSIYLAIIMMPLVGWVGSVAGGRPPQVGDYLFNLPIEQDKPLAKSAFELHEILAYIIIGLVSLHILAALYHHFIRKDDILKRMLPKRGN